MSRFHVAVGFGRLIMSSVEVSKVGACGKRSVSGSTTGMLSILDSFHLRYIFTRIMIIAVEINGIWNEVVRVTVKNGACNVIQMSQKCLLVCRVFTRFIGIRGMPAEADVSAGN